MGDLILERQDYPDHVFWVGREQLVRGRGGRKRKGGEVKL